jgi:beta-N-acetylhexosaminidase
VRVSRQPLLRDQKFKSPMDLRKEGGLELVKQDAEEKCRFLRSFDINVNFAPVADMSDNPEAFIYPRVYGGNVEETAEYTKEVCSIMSREKVGSSLKHFPGYSDNRDTHKELAVDSRPLAQFQREDLVPFQSGIDGGADSIMVSHTIVECFDAEQPASLSPVVHAYIREEMGFDGILMTDDMNMQAIVKHCQGEDPCVRALMCGNDMLMIQDIASGITRIRAAVEDGRITMEQLETSILRVLRWKKKLGLL